MKMMMSRTGRGGVRILMTIRGVSLAAVMTAGRLRKERRRRSRRVMRVRRRMTAAHPHPSRQQSIRGAP
jgi:hypothetical protein